MGVPFHFQSTLKFTLCPTVAGINFQLGFSLNHHFRLTRPSRPALSSTGRDTFLHTAHTSPLFIWKRFDDSFRSLLIQRQTANCSRMSNQSLDTGQADTEKVRGVSGGAGDQGRDVGQRVRHGHRRFEFISRRKSAFNCILRRKTAAEGVQIFPCKKFNNGHDSGSLESGADSWQWNCRAFGAKRHTHIHTQRTGRRELRLTRHAEEAISLRTI